MDIRDGRSFRCRLKLPLGSKQKYSLRCKLKRENPYRKARTALWYGFDFLLRKNAAEWEEKMMYSTRIYANIVEAFT